MTDRFGEAVRRLDTPLTPLLIAALLAGIFGAALLRRNGYDVSRLVVAGDRFADRDAVPAGLFVYPRSDGYDGQFYYRLTLDPFTARRSDFGITIDNPPYRQQRLLFPLMAWTVTFGCPERAAAGLFAVNLAALAAVGWIGGHLARQHGRHALWGLLPALYPGFLLSTARDCAEVAAGALALGSLALVGKRRYRLATYALVLATLTRETTAVVALGAAAVAAASLAGRARRPVPAYVFAIPLAAQVAWQLGLSLVWGDVSADPYNTLTPIPFEGIARLVASILTGWNWLRATWLAQLAFLAATSALALACLRSSTAAPFVKAAWALGLLLAIFLSPNIWVEDWGFMRASTEVYLLSAVVVVGGCRLTRGAFAIALCAVYSLLFLDLTLGGH